MFNIVWGYIAMLLTYNYLCYFKHDFPSIYSLHYLTHFYRAFI